MTRANPLTSSKIPPSFFRSPLFLWMAPSSTAIVIALLSGIMAGIDGVSDRFLFGAGATEMTKRLLSLHGVLFVFGVVVPSASLGLGLKFSSRKSEPESDFTAWLVALMLYATGVGILVLAGVEGGLPARWVLPTPEVSRFSAPSPLKFCLGIALLACACSLASLRTLRIVHRKRGVIAFRAGRGFLGGGVVVAAAMQFIAGPFLMGSLLGVALLRGSMLAATELNVSIQHWLFWIGTHLFAYSVFFPMIGFLLELLNRHAVRKPNWERVFFSHGFLAFLFVLTVPHHLPAFASPYQRAVATLAGALQVIPFSLYALEAIRSFASGIGRPNSFSFSLAASGAFFIGLGLISGLGLNWFSLVSHLGGTTFVQAHLHSLLGCGWTMLALAVMGDMPGAGSAIESKALPKLSLVALMWGGICFVAPLFIIGLEGKPASLSPVTESQRVCQIVSLAGASVFLVGTGLALLHFALLKLAAPTPRFSIPPS